MKAATIHELKKELNTIPPKQILELCLRLARFKKENKELLTYLLFQAHDEQSYIKNVKNEMDVQFIELPKANLYYTKKTLRKILRATNKYIRYTGLKQTEVELLLYFCKKIKTSAIRINKSRALINLYAQQLKKIDTAANMLQEDLQYDYLKELEQLS